MLHTTFPFESKRLTYRPYEAGDKAWLFHMRQDEAQMRYVPFGGETWDEMDAVMERRMALTKIERPGDGIMCVMVEKQSGARVGEVMLRHFTVADETGEVGYVLHPDFQGRGYATEGAKEMLRLGFEGAGFHRMIGICDAENAASRRTLLRLGMREEALHREAVKADDGWRDQVVCAILAEEWRAGAGALAAAPTRNST